MSTVPWVEAVKQKWREVRPNEDVRMIEKAFQLSDAMVVLAHMSFEAGRQYQADHPTARTDFPDYNAPAK
jgi:hypothetical protein